MSSEIVLKQSSSRLVSYLLVNGIYSKVKFLAKPNLFGLAVPEASMSGPFASVWKDIEYFSTRKVYNSA